MKDDIKLVSSILFILGLLIKIVSQFGLWQATTVVLWAVAYAIVLGFCLLVCLLVVAGWIATRDFPFGS